MPFRRLADLPIVLPGRPNVLRTVMEQFAARCDTRLAPFDCDSLPAIVKLICRSGHAAVMPHFAFTEEMARGLMVALPIVDPTPSWRLSVVVSQRTINPRGSGAVAQVLAEVIAALVQQDVWRARLKDAVREPAAP
ncbi:MAG: hypothetical protein B7Z30_09940 [Rhizobiales bacterium 12-68-15]|nr:MAG: hypothetical protein B7Z30_09940 [Rhizobiales bacterium 12-68-15]